MVRITIYLDEETERLVRRHAKGSARREWPADVISLFGSWKDEDFPDTNELRKGYGADVSREQF